MSDATMFYGATNVDRPYSGDTGFLKSTSFDIDVSGMTANTTLFPGDSGPVQYLPEGSSLMGNVAIVCLEPLQFTGALPFFRIHAADRDNNIVMFFGFSYFLNSFSLGATGRTYQTSGALHRDHAPVDVTPAVFLQTNTNIVKGRFRIHAMSVNNRR